MLPAAARLRRPADFSAAVRAGRRAGTPTLVVHLRVEPAADVPRAGFIVNRSIGPAVVRNRVRRRLRHLVRARLDRLPAGALLVVRATPAAAGRDYAGLGDDLDAALERAVARVAPAAAPRGTADGGR